MIKYILIILFLFYSNISNAVDDPFTSKKVIEDTLLAMPKCLHHRISAHFCFWFSSDVGVNTTPILSHYLPDLIISVYNKPNENPWFEINKILDTLGKPVQQYIVKTATGFEVGSGNHSFSSEDEQNVFFKEVDVIGNPAIALIPEHLLLSSTSRPFKPYYQSMVDSLLWRGIPPAALPEEGLAMGLNIVHHVGKGLINWGGVYPHEGKVASNNDAKASAVIAQRAGDLVTSDKVFGHVSQKLSNDCGEHCSAAQIQENSKETYFQMIYPIVQTDCHILGDSESYSSDMLNDKGAYVWVVWRHYEGCADGVGEYLGSS